MSTDVMTPGRTAEQAGRRAAGRAGYRGGEDELLSGQDWSRAAFRIAEREEAGRRDRDGIDERDSGKRPQRPGQQKRPARPGSPVRPSRPVRKPRPGRPTGPGRTGRTTGTTGQGDHALRAPGETKAGRSAVVSAERGQAGKV